MSEIKRAAQLLRQGRLVAFPTETVYGLGADATNASAIERIYRTKGRPSTNPLIVHVASADVARRYAAEWPEAARVLAERFWPGPLTIVLPKNPAIPDNATAGLGTVGLRVPEHPLALELLRAFDGPVAAPSANRSTRVSPTSAQHVRDEFPESAAAGGAEGNEPAMILDGGPCDVGIESTVLDLTRPVPMVLRPGHVTADEIARVVGKVQVHAGSIDAATPAASPGQQSIHYAPRTPAYVVTAADRPALEDRFERDKNANFGLLVLEEFAGPGVMYTLDELRVGRGTRVGMPNAPAAYARELYRWLRVLDAQDLEAIYVEMPPETGEWAAVRDRISRATRPLPRG